MSATAESTRERTDLFLVQVLSTGLTLPILALFSFSWTWPFVALRTSLRAVHSADLGLPPVEDVVLPSTRVMEGLSVLGGVALALAVLTLLVGCATLATLVRRAGVSRRSELGIRAAVGASRADLRSHVIGPLSRRLAFGAAVGTALGVGLYLMLRLFTPEVLGVSVNPFSIPALLGIFAPVAAGVLGARVEVHAALRRFASPLTLQSSTRLAPLGLGGAYFGLIVGILATVGTLAKSQSYADLAPQEWTEARDTLLFEVEDRGGDVALSALETVRSADAGREWHLTSSGALEGLGPSNQEMAECGCFIDGWFAPYTRLYGQRHAVTPGAFAAAGVRVVRGREFTEGDGRAAEGVVVIDDGHLRRFGGVDPVGKLFHISGIGLESEWYRIVGVVDVPEPLDVATKGRVIPGVYFSALQHPPSHAQLFTHDPGGLDDAGARATAALGTAGLTGRSLGTLANRLTEWGRPLSWFALFIGIVSIGAFVVGVYGVTTLTWLNVRSRTSEIGVRRAVGARAWQIRRLVLREVGEVAFVGAALGSILGVGMTVGLADRFRAVDGPETGMLIAVAGALAVAALLAAIGPARRAARVTPIDAIGDVTD